MPIALDESPIAKAWRDLNLTADDVAESVNVNRSFVYDVAKRIKQPSLETASKLSNVLRQPLHVLFPDLFALDRSTLGTVGVGACTEGNSSN